MHHRCRMCSCAAAITAFEVQAWKANKQQHCKRNMPRLIKPIAGIALQLHVWHVPDTSHRVRLLHYQACSIPPGEYPRKDLPWKELTGARTSGEVCG